MAQLIRVLVVEDNEDLLDEVVFQCEYYGLQATGVTCAEEMDQVLMQSNYDVLLLDVGLPGEDGWSIASRLKETLPQMGIIMLTAFSEEGDRSKGLSLGADCYFSKPVNYQSLVEQIQALARRIRLLKQSLSDYEPSSSWQLMLPSRKLILEDDQILSLTHNECCLLKALASSFVGEPVAREALIIALGERPETYDYRRLETAISRLRSKIGAAVDENIIQSVRNQGYVILKNIQFISHI